LDALAEEVAVEAVEAPDRATADAALDVLERAQAFERLLALPEAPGWRFRSAAGGRSQAIRIDPVEVLREWLRGTPLVDIANRHLSAVTDHEFRIEQIVDRITEQFEHYLSWTLGVLIELVNQRLSAMNEEELLSPHLALFVRYGVSSLQALELLTEGVRSREFAQRVAEAAQSEDVGASDLRGWMRAMTISDWRARFAAAPTDLLDLLEFTRVRRGNLLRTLLETSTGSIEAEPVTELRGAADVVITPAPGEPAPAQLLVLDRATNRPLARIPAAAHSDVQAVLDTGIAVETTLVDATLTVTLAVEEA
jgi:hypothetical protein